MYVLMCVRHINGKGGAFYCIELLGKSAAILLVGEMKGIQ